MRTLLVFTANWCVPCRAMKPALNEFIVVHPEITVLVVDVDSSFKAAADNNVMSVPTFIVKEAGVTVARFSGGQTLASLERQALA